MNVVATDTGTLIEVQGTGEGATFARSTLDKMLDVALAGCEQMIELQTEALAQPYPELPTPSPRRAEVTERCWPRATPRSCAELRRIVPPQASSGLEVVGLDDVAAVPGGARDRGDVRGERPRQGPRRGGGHRAARDRRRLRASRSTR